MVFLNTDNSTVERALYKRNSSGTKLFDLVVRLKCLETHYLSRICVSHASGSTMKAQWIDWVSRGQLGEGAASGMNM